MTDNLTALLLYIEGIRDGIDEQDTEYISEYERGVIAALNNVEKMIKFIQEESKQ